jgi:hypothetical protein
MPHIFTLSGQDAVDFINKLAEQDATDFVKALAAAAKSADAGKSNPGPTDLELALDENAALREALREALTRATADGQSAMLGALKELDRLEEENKSLRKAAESNEWEIKRLKKAAEDLRKHCSTRLEDQNMDLRDQVVTLRKGYDAAKTELGQVCVKLVETAAQRDAALREVESVKQHLTDSGVAAFLDRIDLLEKANDRLAESRHHLNVQLDEAKARVLQVETLLARQVDFREAEKAYADARLDELHSSVR